MSGTTRRLAVISQVAAGHIPAYQRHYVAQFASLGYRVLSLEAERNQRWTARMLRQLDRWPWLQAARAWRGAARRVRIAEHVERARVDGVFFIYLDQGFLSSVVAPYRVERWFPWRWAGVVTAPRAIRGLDSPFAGPERVLAARDCCAVVVTDSEFVGPCATTWPGRRVIAMPEIADLSAPGSLPEIAGLREFAGGRQLVGLLGVISAKKNIESFIALARRARTALPNTAFIIAGDFSADACRRSERRRLAALLAELPDNCRFFGQPIPDGPAFNAWLDACDAIWLAYRDVVYKSNLLTKAAHFRKPVLVSPGSIMAEHTTKFQLGETVPASDADACVAALQRILASGTVVRNFAGFAALNGLAALARTASEIGTALTAPEG